MIAKDILKIRQYEPDLQAAGLTTDDLNKMITQAIREQNPFWWGVIIGLKYNQLQRIRVNELSTVSEPEFTALVKVQYGSPYPTKGQGRTGRVIKWY